MSNTFGVDLIQICRLENNSCPIRNLVCANIEHIQAILIHEDYHYYCLRRFRVTEEYFFKIDSKHPMNHQTIHRRDILTYLRTLLELQCNIYVVIQGISEEINGQVSSDNIQRRLWALPEASADCELLIGTF